MKLLIVEDSQPVSERLRTTFSEVPGLQTEIATDVRQGIARFRELGPEMVVLDVQLPDGSGLDVLEIIKQERPATRVLMFSNHAFYRKRCVAEGADYFFDKSMDFEVLASTVRALVEVRP